MKGYLLEYGQLTSSYPTEENDPFPPSATDYHGLLRQSEDLMKLSPMQGGILTDIPFVGLVKISTAA